MRSDERFSGNPDELLLSSDGTTAKGEGVVSLLGTGEPTLPLVSLDLGDFLCEAGKERFKERDRDLAGVE